MPKIYTFLFLFYLASGFQVKSQCALPSNIYEFKIGSKSYELIKEKKSWVAAATCAKERGGYLVQINDQSEQTAVYAAIQSSGISTTYSGVMDGGGTSYVWIGGTDKKTEGSWIWDGDGNDLGNLFWTGQGDAGSGGGSAVSYVNWGGKSVSTFHEPDDFGSNQDAAAMALAGWPLGTTLLGVAGEWNDISQLNELYYLVELDNGTGLNDFNEKQGFQILHDPNYETLKVNWDKNVFPKSVEIFSIDGKLVQEITLDQTKTELTISLIGANLYIVKLNTQNKPLVAKILVQ